jgi:hypothetical protein
MSTVALPSIGRTTRSDCGVRFQTSLNDEIIAR